MTQAAILAASGSPGTTTGFKNRIINGNFAINQRGNAVTSSNTEQYPVDRFSVYRDGSAASFIAQQYGDAPAGFSYSLLCTTSSAGTGATNDGYWLAQKIEGFNTADLAWGTASAKSVTISFWVKSSLTGQFGGTLVNSAFNYSYPFSYTISSVGTWEYKTITIVGPTSGTWIGATNGIGIRVYWDMGSGASLKGTAGAWTASGLTGATGDVSLVGTAGATWYVSGVQLEVGTTATNFDFRSIGTELSLCQRYYYQVATGNYFGGLYNNTSNGMVVMKHAVTMRANPTVNYTISGGGALNGTYLYPDTSTIYIASNTPSLSTFNASAEL